MKKKKKLRTHQESIAKLRVFELGKKIGREEVIEKLIELLKLDERYEPKHRDY